MINKKIAMLGITTLLYSSFSLAGLYIHQVDPVEAKKNSYVVIHDDNSENSNSIKNKTSDFSQNISSKKQQIAQNDMTGKERNTGFSVRHKNLGGKESVNDKITQGTKVTPYKGNMGNQKNGHSITPPVEKHVAYMEKGFLSNSMRKHLEDMGWSLEWSSGSDREITVAYQIEYKTPVDFVQQISGLYGIFVDVYPMNKTVHVQD